MSAHTFPATRFLVAANLVVFVAMCVVSGGQAIQAPSSEMLIDWGANFGLLTLNGEWWRLFSSMFLHIGFVHIAFNMAALWNLGQSSEELFGTKRFLNMYFISGFGGSCLSVLFSPGVTSAGASGAIFGIYGSLFAFFFAHRKVMSKESFIAGIKSATTFLVLNIIIGLSFHCDNFCHFGGLVSGFICGTLYLPRPNKAVSRHPILGTFVLISAIYGLFNFAKTVPIDMGEQYCAHMVDELDRVGKYAEAQSFINKAMEKKPNNANLFYIRSVSNFNAKHYDQALADVDKALSIEPGLKPASELRSALKANFVPATESTK